GPLSDHDLEREAATWSAFVHPLFCWARGCSTKLALALAWQLPIATTRAGARGYTWRDGTLPMADAPEAFARLASELVNPAAASRARQHVAAIARSSPHADAARGSARSACHDRRPDAAARARRRELELGNRRSRIVPGVR